ncbi:universal stress protein [Geminicoccus roseus]|uniref:universal stress protein n=1 Tax=Geminicoccus roseus TaxID=404900 RepID=UPI0003FB6AC7|nr:universal stress protein [Geminicoccus roseus]
MFRHLLIPTDGSALATAALQKGLRFAQEIGAQVTVLTVVEPFLPFSMTPYQVTETPSSFHEQAARHAQGILDAAWKEGQALGIDCGMVEVEHSQPHEAIIGTAAAKGCDLIAMASHGRRGMSALLLGSQTSRVLTHSKVPVLVYR